MDVQHVLASVTLMIIVMGCLGNLLSLTLFLKHSSSVNVLLSALAFVDLCLLLFAVPVFVVPNLDIWVDETDSGTKLISYLAYILKFVYPVNLVFQTCSIYTMVLITMERWVAVNKPLQVSIWCTAQTSRKAITCIFVLSLLYNVPRFFEYNIIYTSTGASYKRNLRDNPNYMIIFFTICYLCTHFIIPFGLILVLNCHVITSILKLRKERLSLTRQQIREQSTTVMLLVVIFIFAVCNTLPFLLNLAECVKPDLFADESTASLAFQLNDLSTLLVVFNSSTTWIVYILFSAKYRQTAARILWRCYLFGKNNMHYNSLSRTYSMRFSVSMNKKQNMSTNCAITKKFTTKQADRSMPEFNEGIQRSASFMMLPKFTKRQSARSMVSCKSVRTPQHRKNVVLTTPINNSLLAAPPTYISQSQWSASTDKPIRPLLEN